VIYTQAILEFDGEKWTFAGLNSTPVVRVDRVKLRRTLRKLGFKKIFYYGGQMYGPLFKSEFNPAASEFLNIVAKK
jgi:hypothetical protein